MRPRDDQPQQQPESSGTGKPGEKGAYDWRRDEPAVEASHAPDSGVSRDPDSSSAAAEGPSARKPPYVGGKAWRGALILLTFLVIVAAGALWIYAGFTP